MATNLPNVGKLRKNSSIDDDFGPDPTRLVPRLKQIHKLCSVYGEEDVGALYQSPGRVWPRNSGAVDRPKPQRSNDVTNQRATPEMHNDTPITDDDEESSSSIGERLRALRKTANVVKLGWGGKYYHGTAQENVAPILQEGLRPSKGGGVSFISPSPTVARFFGASKEIDPTTLDPSRPVQMVGSLVKRLARNFVHQDPLLITPNGIPLGVDPMLPRLAKTTSHHIPPSLIQKVEPSLVTRALRTLVKRASQSKNSEGFELQGHTEVQGLPIAIENRKGSVRKGTDADGNEWRTEMKFPYGYIKGSKGADGEGVDVYVGPNKSALTAYVVHQRDKDTGKYDEDKVMLGFDSKKDAKEAFLDHYDDPSFLGPISEVPVERLKELVASKKKLVKISHPLLASLLQEVRTLL